MDTGTTEPFWKKIRSRGEAVAIVDADSGTNWSYAQLAVAVDRAARDLYRPQPAVVLLFAGKDRGAIVWYLAALQCGHSVFLSPVAVEHPGAAALIEAYRPEIIVFRLGVPDAAVVEPYRRLPPVHGYNILFRRVNHDSPPHPDLALVLSTSASTGSPKAVRLSTRGLQGVAHDVACALSLTEQDRSLISLPLSYVYGLSVLNSSLSAGASVVTASGTPADRGYWARITGSRVTVVPAVSQTFEFMRVLALAPGHLPSVRKFTHSGQSLEPGLFHWLYESFAPAGVEIYLMYGQTEAGGRMTVLPPRYLPGACRSVGLPVGTSQVRIDGDGEIVFSGAGVMLGYAQERTDLARADELGGVLRTGDTGHLDSEGLLFITGRVSRYCKAYGQRISLDDVERQLGGVTAAAIEKDGIIAVFMEGVLADNAAVRLDLAQRFHLPPQTFRVVSVAELPRTERGKVAYRALSEML